MHQVHPDPGLLVLSEPEETPFYLVRVQEVTHGCFGDVPVTQKDRSVLGVAGGHTGDRGSLGSDTTRDRSTQDETEIRLLRTRRKGMDRIDSRGGPSETGTSGWTQTTFPRERIVSRVKDVKCRPERSDSNRGKREKTKGS